MAFIVSRYSTTTCCSGENKLSNIRSFTANFAIGRGINFLQWRFLVGKKYNEAFYFFFVFIEYVQWKYIFSSNTTVCVSNVKPVKQITFLGHSITITSAVITKDYPSWQAFEREGKGSFRRERNARGAWSRALIPFSFPFEHLPRRLTKDRLKVISLSTSS